MPVIVIPARMASTRFPGKPLCDLVGNGKPMVQWVVEAARKANVADRVIVATPDQEIFDACQAFAAEAVMTRFDHPSGTDRIAEVAEKIDTDFFINVQGDEPLIDPLTIAACAAPLAEDPSVEMASIWAECELDEIENPAVVKVVTALNGDALYFSRHAIPFQRNPGIVGHKKHVGIYAYRRETVIRFSKWQVSPLEASESLEQLRFLENGVRIKMAGGGAPGLAVDTPEQAAEVRRILLQQARPCGELSV